MAAGVCSQSGIVSTAFAFAAAARKSSTDFNSPARRSATAAQTKIDNHKVFIRKGLIAEEGEHCVEGSSRKVEIPAPIALLRNSSSRSYPSLWPLIQLDWWQSSWVWAQAHRTSIGHDRRFWESLLLFASPSDLFFSEKLSSPRLALPWPIFKSPVA